MTEVPTLAADDDANRRRASSTLLAQMTLDEKLAQIVGFWEKEDGEAVAPLQGEFGAVTSLERVLPPRARPPHPARTAPARSTPPSGPAGCGRSSAGSSPRPGSASRRSCTRSA